MTKIVSFKICPFVQRVIALLEAKNMPYEIEYIELGNKPDWFLEVSPNQQVPILITDKGQALFESEAIIEYIEEVSKPLIKDLTPTRRAKDRAWGYQGAKLYLAQCGAMQSADKVSLIERRANLNKAFDKIENALGKGPFFNGKEFGNVDIAWLPILHRASIIKKRIGFDFFDDFPKVQSWQTAVLKTGVPTKSVSEDFEEAFSNFYLSDRTFLGRGANFDEDIVDSRAAITSIG